MGLGRFSLRRKVPFAGPRRKAEGGRRSIFPGNLGGEFFIFLIFNFYFEGAEERGAGFGLR